MINEAEVLTLLSSLITIPSVNPAFRQPGDPDDWFLEGKAAEFVASWLRNAGIPVEVDMVEPGRPNVIARLSGRGDGPRWLWEGHLDTVQVTGMERPFEPRLEAGRLYGRGAVDDKGCLTAFMLALRELAADPPPGNVTFLAAIDEEYRFTGITHYLERGEFHDRGIAGEPTELGLVRACKGCVRWYVDVVGRSAHTSKPHEGADAIAAGARLLARFEDEIRLHTINHPLLGGPTLVCTGFEAGEGPNTVASRASMRFDYRYLPGQDGMEVWRRLKQVAEDFGATVSPARFVVHEPFIDSSAMDVPGDAPVIAIMGAICAKHGIDPTPAGVPFGSDATKMTNAGIPTLIFGPGSIDQAHSREEFVEIASVAKAAQMLVEAARVPG